MRGLRQILFLFCLLLGIAGCSWFNFFGSDEESKESDTYQKGLEAYQKKKYDNAIKHFRSVSPKSPNYSKTLRLIEQIPMQRAEKAVAQKDYNTAMQELDKITEGNSNYSKAQKLKTKVYYESALVNYEKASSSMRIPALEELAKVAVETNNRENILRTIEMIGDELNQSTKAPDISQLITLLHSTVEPTRDSEVIHVGLEHAFQAYERFNTQPRLRNQLLRLIAALKIKLQ
ncbi:MAG: hypothetical protein HQM14_02785 [SAR324 cluster bacterium]|nr:hypothetical protein [SAR324 cluster bacterium]